MRGARFKDANLECNNEQGKAQLPTLRGTNRGARFEDANLECNTECGKT
jgi:hypothetical protein